MAPLIVSCPCSSNQSTLPSEVTAPTILVICHCQECQRRTGSAFHIGACFVGGCKEWLVSPENSAKISYNDWNTSSGNSTQRAFCQQCGGTIGMWRLDPTSSTPSDGKEFDTDSKGKETQWVTVPASNLRNYDWVPILREQKDKVVHCWTECAIFKNILAGYPLQFTQNPPAAA